MFDMVQVSSAASEILAVSLKTVLIHFASETFLYLYAQSLEHEAEIQVTLVTYTLTNLD